MYLFCFIIESMSFITSIGTAVPGNKFQQETIASFMEHVMQPDYENSRKLKTIFKSSGIQSRYSVLNDYGRTSNFEFYPNASEHLFPSTTERIEQFKIHALPLSIEAIQNALPKRDPDFHNKITHLIVVSCTGMYAPGLDIDLVKKLHLRNEVERTCITFMGCYAAFNAIKVADSFCKTNPNAVVLIVCVELCTLHFQREVTDDNLLANALFSDGAAALIVQGKKESGWNLTPEIFHNGLAYNGQEHMAWSIGNLGFEMKLSTYVPEIIQQGIKNLTTTLLNKVSKSVGEISHYAIHPGGKKILEVIEKELQITKDQNLPAYSVLREYGNMSSATIVFVLQHILKNVNPNDDGKTILSFAFGPGLTLESMLLKMHYVR